MIRGRTSAGSSTRRKYTLRKKLPQVLLRQQNVACKTFFCWITRKILQNLLPQESAEEPSTFLLHDPAEEHLLPLQFPKATFTRAEEPLSSTSTTTGH